VGTLEEARKTIDALRRLSPHNPEIDLLDVRACARSADFAGARKAAREVVADAKAVGARLAEAKGLHAEAWVLLQLGETDAASALFEEVRGRFQEMGDHRDEIEALNALASMAYERGDHEGARRRLEEVVARARADGNDELGSTAQGNLAVLLLELGELSEGMALLDDQLRRVRATPGNTSEGWLLISMGEALMDGGDLARAEQTLEEGLGLLRKQSRLVDVIGGEDSLARLLLERGDTERALQATADALTLVASSGSGPLGATIHATRGTILLAAGRHADARAELGLALAELDGEDQRKDRMRALAALARVELSSGRGTDALRAVEEAEALRARISAAYMSAREVVIAAAVVRGSIGTAGERDAARRALAELIADAEAHGQTALALSARLDLGELEIRSGRRADGRARLAALAVEAERRGFVAIARRARAAAGR
jgi:tetratricopeptide (TPR) repeat protein